MPKSTFVYVVYIASTPEKVWSGLLDGEFTRQYWEHENVSDWKAGSKWEHRKGSESGEASILGEVVEARKPSRLVLTWAAPHEAKLRHRHSKVTFEIEAVADMTRLTVTHDELEANSDMERKITSGWPRVLSSLKTLLETGKPLKTWAGR
ncbi:MAG TPA: SRPBCC family protein [Candidatus Polarisedimenticolia bacterium]|jgi:uncharacterized protein YndB with AHSA1/START domain|nr:SRPBCC family protein [Candidatus Polarisedimenticolia bacterium]